MRTEGGLGVPDMCGRFFLRPLPDQIAQALGATLSSDLSLQCSASLAPGCGVSLVKAEGRERVFKNALWGLPASARRPSALIFNARAESLSEKRSFRPLLQAGRCLVPASGFFEWRGPKGQKQLFAFGPRLGQLLVFAGLYDALTERCVIVTTAPNSLVRSIHDRMPAVLGRRAASDWLFGGQREALSRLGPCPEEWLELWALPGIPALDDPRLLPPRSR